MGYNRQYPLENYSTSLMDTEVYVYNIVFEYQIY